jgi:hypothetical protein
LSAFAINVTNVPAHTELLLALDVIEIEGTKIELTLSTMAALNAVLFTAQLAFETKLQVMTSPLLKVFEVKVELPFPTFNPFNCH